MTRSAKSRPGALTLVEVMVSVALLGVLLLTVGPTLRRTSASTHGAAISLAAVLTEVRQQAIARQEPVALVIPGGSGQADSFYILAGDQPRVTKVQRLGSEQPGARLMVGHWPLDANQLRDPSLTTTITTPPESSRDLSFSLDAWGLPRSNDYAFVFTPGGKLLTNDLPNFDGAYHIVVSHGGLTSPSGAPGTGAMSSPPSLFQLSEVGTPYTIVLQPSGLVSVVPGLIANASVAVKEHATVAAAPNPPGVDPQPSTPPVVTGVSLLPDPAKLNLPAGVQALVAPDRHLTLTVRATSPERAPLFCQWTAAGGGLSSDRPVRMTYRQDTAEWESVWQWHPPAGAAAGQQFPLEGVVSDGFGNQVAALIGAAPGVNPVVQVGDASLKLAFASDREGGHQVHTVNGDGTALANLMPGNRFGWNTRWSPDRQRLLFVRSVGAQRDVFLSYADGALQTNLTNHPGYDDWPVWSPRGGQIAWVTDRDGASESQIYVMNADGSSPANLSNSPGHNCNAPAWSPDASKIAFLKTESASLSLPWVMNADGSGQVQLGTAAMFPIGVGHATSLGVGTFSWSPDSTRVCWAANDGAGGQRIFVANADGTGAPLQITSSGTDSEPVWLLDGKICFRSTRDGNSEIYAMNPDGSGQTNLSNDPSDNIMPLWTPNPTLVGFVVVNPLSLPVDQDIWLMGTDGSSKRNLTTDTADDFYASFR